MANKTIYVRDADLPLWELAQSKLGESVSSAFVEYLRERLKEKLDMVQAIDELLAEINSAHSLDTERHPSYSPIITAQDTDRIGYKLHQKRANPERVMSLVVDSFSFDSHGRLSPAAKSRITTEVVKFWDGRCSDRHKFVDATVVSSSERETRLLCELRRMAGDTPQMRMNPGQRLKAVEVLGFSEAEVEEAWQRLKEHRLVVEKPASESFVLTPNGVDLADGLLAQESGANRPKPRIGF